MAQDNPGVGKLKFSADYDLPVVQRRLATNKKLRESAYTAGERDTLDREIKRDTPRGWWESLFTDEFGQETILPVAIPGIGSGWSGTELLLAHKASERGYATSEQREMLLNWHDYSVRPSTTWGKAASIFREVPAFGVEFYLSGGTATFGRKALVKGAKLTLGRTLSKIMVTGFREKAEMEGTKALARVLPSLKEAVLSAPGQSVRMTLQGEAARLATGLVGIESDGGPIRGGMYMNYIRNRYRIVPENEYGASVRVMDDSYGMWSHAMPHAVVDNLIEVFSEHTGVAISHMVPALKLSLLGKPLGKGGVAEKVLASLGLAGDVPASRMMQRFGASGLIPEMGEEFIGAITRDAVHAIAPGLADEGNTQYLIDNIVPITLGMGLGMFGMSAGVSSISYYDGLNKHGRVNENQSRIFSILNKTGATEEGRTGVLRGAERMVRLKEAGLSAEGSADLAATASTRVAFFSSDLVKQKAQENAERKRLTSGETEEVSHDDVLHETNLLWAEFGGTAMFAETVHLNEETGEETTVATSPAIEFLLEHGVITEDEAADLLNRAEQYLEEFNDALESGKLDAYWEALGYEGIGIELAKAAESKVTGAMDPNVLQVGAFNRAQRDLRILQSVYAGGKGSAEMGGAVARRVFDPKLAPEAEHIQKELVASVEKEYEDWSRDNESDVNEALAAAEAESGQKFEQIEDENPDEAVLAAQALGVIVVPVSTESNSIMGYWHAETKTLLYNPQAIKDQAAAKGMDVTDMSSITIYRELLRAHVTDLGAGGGAWLRAAAEWLKEVDPKFQVELLLNKEIYKNDSSEQALVSEVTFRLARFAQLNRRQKEIEPPSGAMGWLRSFASTLMEIVLPRTFFMSTRVKGLIEALEEAGFNTEGMTPSQVLMADATAAHVHQIVSMLSPAKTVVRDVVSEAERMLEEERQKFVEETSRGLFDRGGEEATEVEPEEEEVLDELPQDLRDEGDYDSDPDAAFDLEDEAEQKEVETEYQLPEETEEEPSAGLFPDAALKAKYAHLTRDYLKKLPFKKLVEVARELRSENIYVTNVSGSKATVMESILTALKDPASGFMALDSVDTSEGDLRVIIEDTVQPMVNDFFATLDIDPPTIRLERDMDDEYWNSGTMGMYWARRPGEKGPDVHVIVLHDELLRRLDPEYGDSQWGRVYALEVLAHEMGHAIDFEWLAWTQEERRELDKEYEAWLDRHPRRSSLQHRYDSDNLSGRDVVDNMLAHASRKYGVSKSKTLKNIRDMENSPGFDPEGIQSRDTALDPDYVFSRNEWLADTIGQYLMTGKRGLNLSKSGLPIVRRLAEKIKGAYEWLLRGNAPFGKLAKDRQVSAAVARIIEKRYDEIVSLREYEDSLDSEGRWETTGFMALEETGSGRSGVIHYGKSFDDLNVSTFSKLIAANKLVVIPRGRVARKVVWFGPVDYAYAGANHKAQRMPDVLEKLARRIESETGAPAGYYNSVLANLYPSGGQIGYHSDGEPIFVGKDGAVGFVATISLGGDAEIRIQPRLTRYRTKEEVYKIGNGDMYLMPDGDFQSVKPLPGGKDNRHLHQVGPASETRVSLTFRHVPSNVTAAAAYEQFAGGGAGAARQVESMRKAGIRHYGNPFTNLSGQTRATEKVGSISEAVDAYSGWLAGTDHKGISQPQRLWILEQVNSGALDGVQLTYYKGGYTSHADALADFVASVRGEKARPSVVITSGGKAGPVVRSAEKAASLNPKAHPDVGHVVQIISGAQDGADQAGLRWAKMFGLKTGGTMPAGWVTETGPKKNLADEYLLDEGGRGFADRTTKNVMNSDGTVYFGKAFTPGWMATKGAADKNQRPFLNDPTVGEFRAWVKEHGIKTLNVAGNREGLNPGIGERVEEFLSNAFDPNYKEERRSFPRVTTSIELGRGFSREDFDSEDGTETLRGPARILVPFSAAKEGDEVIVSDSGAIYFGTVSSVSVGGNVVVNVETETEGMSGVQGPVYWEPLDFRVIKTSQHPLETHTRNLYHPAYSLALSEEDGRVYWRQRGGSRVLVGWSVPPEAEEGEGLSSGNEEFRGTRLTQGLSVPAGGRLEVESEEDQVTEQEIQASGKDWFERMYKQFDLDQFVSNEEGRVGFREPKAGRWMLSPANLFEPYENTMISYSRAGYRNPFMDSDADPHGTAQFEKWLNNDSESDVFPDQRAWILDQIESGKLDGIQLGYPYIGHRSHAHVLRDFVIKTRGRNASPTVRQMSSDQRPYKPSGMQEMVSRHKPRASRYGFYAALANLLDTDVATAKIILKVTPMGLKINHKAIWKAIDAVSGEDGGLIKQSDIDLAEATIGKSFERLINPISDVLTDYYQGVLTGHLLNDLISKAEYGSPVWTLLNMFKYSVSVVTGKDSPHAGGTYRMGGLDLSGSEEGSSMELIDIAGADDVHRREEDKEDSSPALESLPDLGQSLNVQAAHEVIGHFFSLAISTSSEADPKGFNAWLKKELEPLKTDKNRDVITTRAWYASFVLGAHGDLSSSKELYVLADLIAMFPGKQGKSDPAEGVAFPLTKPFRRSILASIVSLASDLPVGPNRSVLPTVAVIEDGLVVDMLAELLPAFNETAFDSILASRIGELGEVISEGRVTEAVQIVDEMVAAYASGGGHAPGILDSFRAVSEIMVKREMGYRLSVAKAREKKDKKETGKLVRDAKRSEIMGVSGWARALSEHKGLSDLKPLFKHITLLARLQGMRASLEIRAANLAEAQAPGYGSNVPSPLGIALYAGASEAALKYREQAQVLDHAIELMGKGDMIGLAGLLAVDHSRSPEVFVKASKDRYVATPIIPRFQNSLEETIHRAVVSGKSVVGLKVPGGEAQVVLDPGVMSTKDPKAAPLGGVLDIFKKLTEDSSGSGFMAMDPVTAGMRVAFEKKGGHVPSMWDVSRIPMIADSRESTALFVLSYERWLEDSQEWEFRINGDYAKSAEGVIDYVEGVEKLAGKEKDARVLQLRAALFMRMEMAYWQTDLGRKRQLSNNPTWEKAKNERELWDHYAKSGKLGKQHRAIFDLMMEMQENPEKWAGINDIFNRMYQQQSQITDMAERAGLIEKGVSHHMHLSWVHKDAKDEDVQQDIGARTDVGSESAHKRLTSVLHGLSLGWKLREMDGLKSLSKSGKRVTESVHNRALLYSLELTGVIKKIGPKPRLGYVAMEDRFYDGYEAEKWVAKFLNNAMSRMRVMDIENKGIRTYMKTTVMMKHNLLMLGFFHHHAFPRSYFFTVDGKAAWKSFFKLGHIAMASTGSYMYAAGRGTRKGLDDRADRFGAYTMGRVAIREKMPLLIELVRLGLKIQVGDDVRATASGGGYDMDEVAQMDESIEKAGKWLSDKGAPEFFTNKVVAMIQGVRGFQRQTATWLFNDLGSNLKAAQAILHVEEALERHKERLKTDYDGSFRKGLIKGIASLSNEDFGGINERATTGRLDTLAGTGVAMPRHARTTMWLRALFLAPDWTESNLMTVLRTVWKDGDMTTDEEMNNIQRRLHQHMWLRIISRGLFLQITMNALMAGLDPDREFLDLYKEAGFPGLGDELAPKWQKLRWIDANVSYLSPNESRKFISVLGHFADPFHWATDMFNEDGGFLSPIMKKGSPGAKAVLSAMTGVDWAGRRFSSWDEFWGTDDDAGVYQRRTKQSDGTYKEAGESKAGRYKWQISHYGLDRGSVASGELFTYTLEQLRRFLPIQTRTLMDTAMGTKDEMDLLMDLLGFKGSRTWPKE